MHCSRAKCKVSRMRIKARVTTMGHSVTQPCHATRDTVLTSTRVMTPSYVLQEESKVQTAVVVVEELL